MTHQNPQPQSEFRPTGRTSPIRYVYLGSLLIVLGLIWLCDIFGLLPGGTFDFIFSWQVMLLAIGGYFFSVRMWSAGTVFSAIGVVSLVTKYVDLDIRLTEMLIPAAFIFFGVRLLLNYKK